MKGLKPVQFQQSYELSGEDGYNFTIYCSKDGEFGGWQASVNITNWGFNSPETAIAGLIPAVKNLLSKLTEESES